MNIVFRADASTEIGSGHVMRCLTLAEALKQDGHRCVFLSRTHQGNLISLIEAKGFEAITLDVYDDSDDTLAHAHWLGATQSQDAEDCLGKLGEHGFYQVDWLVVDHYGLDATWEIALRQLAQRVMVIDDLADRNHVCELLLDQNLGRETKDYQSLVPETCKILIGPKYALLRPEFAELREYSFARRRENHQLKYLLISLGGVDKDNVTGQVLEALREVSLPDLQKVTIIMGATAPHLADVREKAKRLPWENEVVVNVSDMAKRMAGADLAIGAAGSTSWERCCLGLPTVIFVLAENQRVIADSLTEYNAGLIADVQALPSLIDNITREQLLTMSGASSSLIDGQGVISVTRHVNKSNRQV